MKVILILIFALIQYFSCNSQTNPSQVINFDKHWIDVEFDFVGVTGIYQVKFDTVANLSDGKEYYNLISSPSQDGEDWIATRFSFAEEGPKIFKYDEFNDTSILAYDFSLEVGDTFFSQNTGENLIVVKTDSITLLDGISYKRIYLDCGAFEEVWLEGWGNEYSGLIGVDELCLVDQSAMFLCGYINNEVVVSNGDSCWVDEKVEEPIFPIGTKWTYNYNWKVPSAHDSLILGTYELTVTDTFERNDTLIYIIKSNKFPNHEEWMYQEGEKVYLWKGSMVGWQLTYDFGPGSSYESVFYNPFPDVRGLDTAIVNIDVGSGAKLWFGDRGNQPVQKISIENNGTYEDMPVLADILYHCGNLKGGLSLGLGLALADAPYIIGDLRCFEQGDFSYNFTEALPTNQYIECDSIRYFSSVGDKEIEDLVLTPNPVRDQLNISYNHSNQIVGSIMDNSGRSVMQFSLAPGKLNKSIDAGALMPGMYIVVLSAGERVSRRKIIKVE